MEDPNPKKKKLRDSLSELRLSRRSGKYISDPNDPTRGIFKDPSKDAQKEYRQNLTAKIKQMKKKPNPQEQSQLAGGSVD